MMLVGQSKDRAMSVFMSWLIYLVKRMPQIVKPSGTATYYSTNSLMSAKSECVKVLGEAKDTSHIN